MVDRKASLILHEGLQERLLVGEMKGHQVAVEEHERKVLREAVDTVPVES